MRGEYGGFSLQSFVERFTETLTDMVRLSQRVTDQMIVRPILSGIRVALELIEEDIRLVLEHFTVHQFRYFLLHLHHLVFSLVPNSGRRLLAIASRALKILDRTVPIGQSITDAISS